MCVFFSFFLFTLLYGMSCLLSFISSCQCQFNLTVAKTIKSYLISYLINVNESPILMLEYW